MTRSLSRREVLRAAIPVCAGLAGTVVGATAMFGASADDGDTLPDSAPTGATTPPTIEAAAIPTTSAVLLAFTRPTLQPSVLAAALDHPLVEAHSLVRGGIANFVASRDSEDRVIEQTQPGWSIALEGIAVDPVAHTQFASKADSATLLSLSDGQALLGRTSAELRQISAGGTIELEGGAQLVVVGVVDDATIGAAEFAVSRTTGDAVGLTADRYLLMTHDGDRAELESALRVGLPDPAKIRFRAPGETPFLRQGEAVLPPVMLKQRFGEFEYNRDRPETEALSDFHQEAAWITENVVQVDLPIISAITGRTWPCHRGIADALVGALNELVTLNLAGLISPVPKDFAGIYNPRMVNDNPYDISRHAWAVAVDINYTANRTGTESIQDPRMIEVFRRWGFTEGSNWLQPDAGHFEWVGEPEPT